MVVAVILCGVLAILVLVLFVAFCVYVFQYFRDVPGYLKSIAQSLMVLSNRVNTENDDTEIDV